MAAPAGLAASSEFGSVFTAHMVTATWSESEGWSVPLLTTRRPLSLDPAAVGLHYGQIVFEGLKAHRQVDGGMAVFRPQAHSERMRRSAARLAMPEPPEALFLDAISQLVRKDAWLMPDDESLSLYLRPILMATEPTLALRPARNYLFTMLAFITRGFFSDEQGPLSVWVPTDYARAVRGGTGSAKCAGNYAPAFLAQAEAAEHHCQQVVWLDAVERRWVEEMGGMNLLFVHRQGDRVSITTPPLTDTILPGVTRDSLLALSSALGYEVAERPITINAWRDGCRAGSIVETIACGTAAIVTAVGRVITEAEEWVIGDGATGPVARQLRRAIFELQRGASPDLHSWLYPVVIRHGSAGQQ
jgi:branched-chain amino acid aminotransferase